MGLDIHLELLVVAYRRRADAAGRRLHVLRLDGGRDIGRRDVKTDQALDVVPHAHRILQAREKLRLADARNARDFVQHVDCNIVRDEQRVVLVAGETDELQDRRGLLADGDTLPLDFLRKLRQRGLDAIVDVDRVGVRIGAERETDCEPIAAVVGARRLHVQPLIDADDLGLQRLRDGAFDHRRRGAWEIGRHQHLRRDDVGKLGDRHLRHRERAGDRHDDRDDDRQAGPVDEYR